MACNSVVSSCFGKDFRFVFQNTYIMKLFFKKLPKSIEKSQKMWYNQKDYLYSWLKHCRNKEGNIYGINIRKEKKQTK